MTEERVLEMRGIRKEFPGVIANDDVSFDVRRGEVHALLGENGAGMVHQHFMLIPVMTVAENIVLGMEPPGILLDERGAEQRVRELSEQYGLIVEPRALVSEITVGQEQRVEILKALYLSLIHISEP